MLGNNLRIRQRIMLPNLLALLLLLLLVGLLLLRMDQQREARARVTQVGAEISAAHVLMEDLLNIETGERGFIISGDRAFLEPYQLGKQRLQHDLSRAFALSGRDPQITTMLHQLEGRVSKLLVTQYDALVARRQRMGAADGDHAQLHAILDVVSAKQGKQQMDAIRALTDRMLARLQQRLQTNEAAERRSADVTMAVVLGLVLLAALLLLWVGWGTAGRIGGMVERLTRGADAVASGDLSYPLGEVETEDELGALARALTRMRDHLAATVQRLEQENWLAEQVASAGERLQGVMDQEELAARALAVVDAQLDVVCSAFYAVPLEEDGTLRLVAERNCAEGVAKERALDDGALARCRDDHRVFVLAPVPDDALRVSSALLSGRPARVVVVPLAFDHKLLAVIELATYRVVSEQHLALLQQLAERIAGVLYGVRFTMKMEGLLADADASRIELKERTDELERVSSYKSRFLAAMSHEIRTPMNAILGMGELLEETPLSADQREYLSILRSSGEGLLRIINDILDISKIEAGELTLEARPFDLLRLLERTSEMMALHAHKKGLELVLHVDDGLPAQLLGDEGRVQQVVINLLNNAIKFTEQGEVALHLHLQERFADSGGKDRVRLLVEVKDSGIGIPKEKLALIFNAFTQADSSTTRRFGGTGLGLAISRQLVRKMGGELTVESREGEGSCFAFTMVLEVASDAPALPADAVSTDGVVMLVVDDHAPSREELAWLLSRWGVDVLQAASGAEALALLEARQGTAGEVALLLADCDMAGMDGFSLAETVRARFPEVQELLFLMTTDQLADYKRRAETIGVELMLTKPVCPSALHNLLLTLLQRRGATRTAADASLPPVADGERPLPKMRVLIAEDDRANQTLIAHMMERWGVEYTMVENGQEAVVLVEHQPFDLLLMDVNMPVLDGMEATKRIRAYEAEHGGHLPIVALTALAFADDERACLEAGMDGFLTKPIRRRQLLQVVWELIERGVIKVPDAVPERLFDRARALEMNDGDEALLEMLAQALREDLPRQWARVRATIDDGDCAEVMRAAHKLKGALATLGIAAVRDRVLELENSAREGNLDRCKALRDQLEPMVAQLRQELE